MKLKRQTKRSGGIINAFMSGLCIGFMPKHTMIRELEEKRLWICSPESSQTQTISISLSKKTGIYKK
ncbi:hypothetical protein DO021_03650 [Desulfobacter hydrogenophilus]|uniref:Uncharacterized protein n=1 Tax=Desulfobacter hydrogenophilus TaxID=2291 RepID=A0A328FFN0_9BACT|nr:hypothetical protein DO021_03650 [Desulfobacter hydrogenophilus]